jgi:hypothetical protein
VQDHLESLSFVLDTPNDRVLGHDVVVKEDLVRVDAVSTHFTDLAHLEARRRLVNWNDEQAQSLGLLLELVQGRRARKEDHDLGLLGVGDEDLLPLERPSTVSLLRGGCLQLERVESHIRFGNGETGAVLATADLRDELGTLRVGAEDGQRRRRVDVGMCALGTRESTARLSDGLHHDRGLHHAQSRSSKLLRERNAQPSAVGDRLVELERIGHRLVAFPPVLVAEAGTDIPHCLSHLELGLVQDCRVHESRRSRGRERPS